MKNPGSEDVGAEARKRSRDGASGDRAGLRGSSRDRRTQLETAVTTTSSVESR